MFCTDYGSSVLAWVKNKTSMVTAVKSRVVISNNPCPDLIAAFRSTHSGHLGRSDRRIDVGLSTFVDRAVTDCYMT